MANGRGGAYRLDKRMSAISAESKGSGEWPSSALKMTSLRRGYGLAGEWRSSLRIARMIRKAPSRKGSSNSTA